MLSKKGVTLKGQVVDKSGQPIPFSSLAIKGSAYGVVSNEKGQFSIQILIP
ncbi:MAG: carboxypeptidase-like regulatory domain-containing protein [Cytophagales bacterium]|nr:carboxypeptidase-like regulatory domain-containing protein [Cytophagales bacterium]